MGACRQQNMVMTIFNIGFILYRIVNIIIILYNYIHYPFCNIKSKIKLRKLPSTNRWP